MAVCYRTTLHPTGSSQGLCPLDVGRPQDSSTRCDNPKCLQTLSHLFWGAEDTGSGLPPNHYIPDPRTAGAGCALEEGTIASHHQWLALPWSPLSEGFRHRLDYDVVDGDA